MIKMDKYNKDRKQNIIGGPKHNKGKCIKQKTTTETQYIQRNIKTRKKQNKNNKHTQISNKTNDNENWKQKNNLQFTGLSFTPQLRTSFFEKEQKH